MTILLINGSPSPRSRASALLDAARRDLIQRGHAVRHLRVADLPAAGLLAGSFDDAAIRLAAWAVEQAEVVVVATPVARGAYSGLIKVFLDLLPQTSLKGKAVLPLATGASPLQMLALDYALRPVLQSLTAHHILPGVYAVDEQIALMPEGAAAVLHPELQQRLSDALTHLLEERDHAADLPAAQVPVRFSQLRCSV